MDQNNGGILGKINTPTTSVASGVWSLDSQFEAQSSSIWPLAFPQTTIANSCRFDDGSSDYINRTPSGAGNRKTWTFSIWFKRSGIATGAQHKIFSVAGGGSNNFECYLNTNDTLAFYHYSSNGGVTDSFLGTNQVFRDVSAWYHLVLSVDTTQGTASNRVKMYLNGEQVTSFSSSSYFNQDYDTYINSTAEHRIGGNLNGSQYFDGYMTEIVLVDGQQLDPTSFGAFNPATNIWEPIAYAGTYGTNGFRLDFADSSALGNDVSGNNNDFTVNNLTSVDQSTDTCSNNFATLNPLEAEQNSPTFSDGNLTQTTPNSGGTSGRSTIEIPHTGVWYWEVKIVSTTGTISDNVRLGISTGSSAVEGQNLRYMSNGQYVIPGSANSYGASYQAGDIIGVKVDADNNQVTFYKNGASQGAISYTMVAGETYKAFVGEYSNTIGCVYSMNFGNSPFSISSGNSDPNGYGNFEYSTDSGYALNTKNLAEFG